jgi:hypothetical protein
MASTTLVVMAAGIGSRYGGLKQIDPVGPSGEIVIDYSVYDAIRAGFDKVVFIIRKDIEQAFREKVGQTIEQRIDTEYVFQELDKIPEGFKVPENRTKPWGTSHAVLCAAEAVPGPMAVINADDFYGAESFQILGDYLRSAKDTPDVYDWSMVGFVLRNTLSEHGHVARGVCTVDQAGHLQNITERTKIQPFDDGIKYTEDDGQTWHELDGGRIVSMNLWGFTPSLFTELRQRFPEFLRDNMDNPKSEFLLPFVVDDLIQLGRARVKVLPTDSRWLGVTYQDDKPRVKQAIRDLVDQGAYPENLWA